MKGIADSCSECRQDKAAYFPKSVTEKRSLLDVNEHFEKKSNAVLLVRSH